MANNDIEPLKGQAVRLADNSFLEACRKLEDDWYTRDTMLASGRQVFKHIVESLPAYRDLVGMMQAERKCALAVFQRMHQLMADFPLEEEHRHPHDTAVAIYMLALRTVKPLSVGLDWARMISEMAQEGE